MISAEDLLGRTELELRDTLEKFDKLKKVLQTMTDANYKLLGELMAVIASRERLLNAVPPSLAVQERMQTQFDKAVYCATIEGKYPEFFTTEES